MKSLSSTFASARSSATALVLLLPLLLVGQPAQACPQVLPDQAAGSSEAASDLTAALDALEATQEVSGATE